MPGKKGKKKGKSKGKKHGKGSEASTEKKGIPDNTIKLEYPVPPPLPTGESVSRAA